jgi:hypothetical protein
MRRFAAFAGCLLVVALLLAGRPGMPADAQSATPAASLASSGVTQAPVAGGFVSALPPGGGVANLIQYRFAAGGTMTLGTDAPPLLVIAVESGQLSVASPAPATIQRAPKANAPARTEPLAAGGSARLGPGDSLVSLSAAGTTLKNDGPEDAAILSIAVRPTMGANPAPATAPVAGNGLALALAVVIPPSCPAGSRIGSTSPAATPGGGGGGGGEGGVAMAVAAAPGCVSANATSTP